MEFAFDLYTKRARIGPALVLILPLSLSFVVWFPETRLWEGVVTGVLIAFGGIALLAQMGRDWGVQKENHLHKSWGGKPTTMLLRHHETLNRPVLERRHNKLQEIVPGIRMPSHQEEQENPAAADEVYEACTKFLLEKTRDKDRFPLVFEENCNYGFRRNLWGLKSLGLVFATVGVLSAVVHAYLVYKHHRLLGAIDLVAAIVNVALLLTWVFWFTPGWVKIVALAYAERLLASCEEL